MGRIPGEANMLSKQFKKIHLNYFLIKIRNEHCNNNFLGENIII